MMIPKCRRIRHFLGIHIHRVRDVHQDSLIRAFSSTAKLSASFRIQRRSPYPLSTANITFHRMRKHFFGSQEFSSFSSEMSDQPKLHTTPVQCRRNEERKEEVMNLIQCRLHDQVKTIIDSSGQLNHNGDEEIDERFDHLDIRQEKKKRYEYFRRNHDAYRDGREDRVRRRSSGKIGRGYGSDQATHSSATESSNGDFEDSISPLLSDANDCKGIPVIGKGEEPSLLGILSSSHDEGDNLDTSVAINIDETDKVSYSPPTTKQDQSSLLSLLASGDDDVGSLELQKVSSHSSISQEHSSLQGLLSSSDDEQENLTSEDTLDASSESSTCSTPCENSSFDVPSSGEDCFLPSDDPLELSKEIPSIDSPISRPPSIGRVMDVKESLMELLSDEDDDYFGVQQEATLQPAQQLDSDARSTVKEGCRGTNEVIDNHDDVPREGYHLSNVNRRVFGREETNEGMHNSDDDCDASRILGLSLLEALEEAENGIVPLPLKAASYQSKYAQDAETRDRFMTGTYGALDTIQQKSTMSNSTQPVSSERPLSECDTSKETTCTKGTLHDDSTQPSLLDILSNDSDSEEDLVSYDENTKPNSDIDSIEYSIGQPDHIEEEIAYDLMGETAHNGDGKKHDSIEDSINYVEDDRTHRSIGESLPHIGDDSIFDFDGDVLTNEFVESDESDRWEESSNLPSLQDVLLDAKSLNSVMTKEEWRRYKTISGPEYEVIEDEQHNIMHAFLEELLDGSGTNRWILSTDEFNLLLLYIGTSDMQNRVEMMLKVFLHMDELNRIGVKSGPDCNTFSILLNFLYYRENETAIGNELISSYILRLHHTPSVEKSHSDSDECSSSSHTFILDEDSLSVAMKILRDRHDIANAEKLLELALSDSGQGVEVQPLVFKYLLQLYQYDGRQDEALRLIKLCLEENVSTSARGVSSFISSALRWPRRQLDGKKIPISSYCNSILDILTEMQDSFTPSLDVWEKLMVQSAYAARTESQDSWATTLKACKALLRTENHLKLEYATFKLGLEAAIKKEDPQTAVDVVTRFHLEQLDDTTLHDDYYSTHVQSEDERKEEQLFVWRPRRLTYESTQDETLKSKLPQEVYLDTVKLCLDCKRNDLAETMLQVCPHLHDRTTSQICQVIMTAYANEDGSLHKAEALMEKMNEFDLKQSEHTYAAFLHILAVNQQREKALTVLDSMIQDGITPGQSSFTACMLSALKDCAWEEVIRINSQMEGIGVSANSNTSYAVIMAKAQLATVANKIPVEAMEDVLKSKMPIDERSFFLCAKVLLQQVDGISMKPNTTTQELALQLRRLCDTHPEISSEASSLQEILIKTSNKNGSALDTDKIWRQALKDVIHMSRASQKRL